MKKILLLLLFITGLSNAQNIVFPDANFKAKLLEASPTNYVAMGTSGYMKIDTNNDGEIQQSEALVIISLNVGGSGISDLTGLQFFTNLTYFGCTYNQITNLDVTSLVNLQQLYCHYNNSLVTINASGLANLETFEFYMNPQLTTIDASNCSSLTQFHFNGGILSSVNVSGCTSISEISLENHNLTTLNVSGLTNLVYLYCNGNELTNLVVDGCSSLLSIECMSNQLANLTIINLPSIAAIRADNNLLTTLNLFDLPNLVGLELIGNPIQTLDVSNLPKLALISLGSNFPIEYLNIKNGIYTSIEGSPNNQFNYVCIDDMEMNQFTSGPFTILQAVNSYCTFTPGGNYNTISGTVTFDQNGDGCDVNDLPKQFLKINMNDGSSIPKVTFTNSNGNYNFYTLTGSFTLTPQIENSSWFSFSPSSATIPFATLNNTATQNFCLSPIGFHNDVEVVIVPNIARPGFDANYQIVYKNKGNQALSGTVQFTYEDDVLDYVSATQSPDVQTTGSLTWNYTDLLPFEVRTVSIVMNVNSPMETPVVNIGDQLDFTATINPISGDETPLDNVFGLKQVVVGSFDPNDKTCLEGNVVSTSKIGDYLHYNINFENTGTFPATFVVVKDMIDAAKFDVSTLQVLNASHPMETRVAGNKVEFIFDDINLGPNQHGSVVFKIKTKSTLEEGNTVTNNANIYFDYNFPIETNTTSTTFQTLSNGGFPTDYSVVIAPNPTKNNVNVNCNSNIQSIQLFDVQGRVLMTQLVNDSQSSVDVSNYTNGIYFLKVTTEIGTRVEKIIKE
ncbi:MAG: T9SS type A sorting domain-containing protein [Flavobacteriales bacterium]|nr:T9SS type A sorting domain-containing protein [Flavobacteriales bacterium]